MHCVVPQEEKKRNCLETSKPNRSELRLLHEQDQNDHVFVFVFYPMHYYISEFELRFNLYS